MSRPLPVRRHVAGSDVWDVFYVRAACLGGKCQSKSHSHTGFMTGSQRGLCIINRLIFSLESLNVNTSRDGWVFKSKHSASDGSYKSGDTWAWSCLTIDGHKHESLWANGRGMLSTTYKDKLQLHTHTHTLLILWYNCDCGDYINRWALTLASDLNDTNQKVGD